MILTCSCECLQLNNASGGSALEAETEIGAAVYSSTFQSCVEAGGSNIPAFILLLFDSLLYIDTRPNVDDLQTFPDGNS